ncbi:MAG: hypothetical protein AB7U34_08235 [Novosphingobium sp.]
MQSLTALIMAGVVFGATIPANALSERPDGKLAAHAAGTALLESDAFGTDLLDNRTGPVGKEPTIWQSLAESFRPAEPNQVRIERRVIIRIAPHRPFARPDMLADMQSAQPMPRLSVRKKIKCLPASEIGGVQVDPDNRLILFMRRHRMVGVSLEKGCRAREFYSGFYVERSPDGLICSGRDILQSRAGARCEVSKLHVLAPVRD